MHVAPLRKHLQVAGHDDGTLLRLSFQRFVGHYVEQQFAIMSPVEMVKDFFVSWNTRYPTAPLLPGQQHDAVEAANHVLEQCRFCECVGSGHAVFPNGVITCKLPQEFTDRHSCTLQELLQHTLCDDNALKRCPAVLVLAFDNMYAVGTHHWWVDLKLTGVDADLDLSAVHKS